MSHRCGVRQLQPTSIKLNASSNYYILLRYRQTFTDTRHRSQAASSTSFQPRISLSVSVSDLLFFSNISLVSVCDARATSLIGSHTALMTLNFELFIVLFYFIVLLLFFELNKWRWRRSARINFPRSNISETVKVQDVATLFLCENSYQRVHISLRN